MHCRVLLVDDDAAFTRAITRSTRDFCTMKSALSVSAGLTELYADCRWDAIIADVGLPDGSGLSILESARVVHPGVPLIAVTGNITHRRVNDVFRLGAQVLAKPIRRWMLRAVLDGGYKEGVGALLTCMYRYPDRWDEAVIAYVMTKLDAPRWRQVQTHEWPEVLDHVAREIRAGLPADVSRFRGNVTIH